PFVLIAAQEQMPPAKRRMVWFALLFSAALFAAYLLYTPFEIWTYTRFLLPAIALLSVLGSWAVFALGRRLGSPALQFLAAVAVLLLACRSAAYVSERGILEIPRGDSRYLAAAKFVSDATPASGLIVSMQHSGSIRYYAARTTLRWDWID